MNPLDTTDPLSPTESRPTMIGLRPPWQLPPEPQSINQFLVNHHPWMALAVALAWLAPVGLGSIMEVVFLLHWLR